jgi:hypothetical protein
MNVFVIALLCSMSLSPRECDRTTALDVLTFPPAESELTCMRDAMQTLADLAIQPHDGEFWKVVCVRSSIGKANIG